MEHTIESSLMPLAFPHADITNASLYAITATISTPLPFNAGRFLMYPGRCLAEHPGVKAPGTEKRTTFFPANSVEMVSFLFCGGQMRGGFDKGDAQRREWWHSGTMAEGSTNP